MPNSSTLRCPEPEKLADYLLGKLDAQSSSDYEHHLSQCEPCVETINGLNVSDTFEGVLFGSVSQLPTDAEFHEADGGVVENLMHRMTRLSDPKTSAHQRNPMSADVLRLLEPAESDDELGRIERYVIKEVLGAGSTAVVFLAIDVNLDRTVAIKILRPTLGVAARERFIAEARATANLNDPNIVTIFHVGENEDLAFIVMQWLPGETLERRLHRESVLSSEQTRKFGKQIASGLAAAHAKGLVHRDIKPANLWITENDEVKILDFGLVRIMDEDPQLTCTGMIAGTPCFMSPEQSRGDELDTRSDLFSLGCVMYQCLTGKLPFSSSNALATLQSIQRDIPVRPQELDDGVPENDSDLVMMLLEKSPWRRPTSVREALSTDRANWDFDCVHYANESRHSVSNPETFKSSADRGSADGKRIRSRMFWLIAFAICCLLAWGGFAFGPQIIRVATDQGLIEIQSDDPDVQVEVTDGGDWIEVVDLKTKQSLQIKSGTYQIRALGEENSVSIDKEKLTLSRGEKVIVTVTKKPEQLAASENITQVEPGETIPLLSLQKVEAELANLMANIEQQRKMGDLDDAGYVAELSKIAAMTGSLELRKKLKDQSKTVDVDPNHRLQPGDVVRVFVVGVTGGLSDFVGSGKTDALGQKFQIRSDGTLSLPLIEPIDVEGKTVLEAENQIRKVYVEDNKILTPEPRPFISVTLEANVTTEPSLLNEPVYDGMTFEQCLALVKYERDGAKLLKPLKGLMALAREDQKDELSVLIWDAIKRVRGIKLDSHIEQQFFRWCNEEFLHQCYLELASSRDSYSWRLVSITLEDSLERLTPIHDKLCLLATKSTEKDMLFAAPVLAMLIKSAKLSPDIRKDAIATLIGKASVTSGNQSYFLKLLAETAPDTAGLGKLVGQWILKSDFFISIPKPLLLLSPENQTEAIPFVAQAALKFGERSALVEYLADVPDRIFEEVHQEYEEKANSPESTTPQRTAASVLAMRQERKRDRKALEESDL